MRILVAEDDPSLQKGLLQALTAAGHQVTTAGDGLHADLLLGTDDFDLLVLDLGLPKMDGLVVLERLRQSGKRMAVLILSARDRPQDRVLGLDRGADDYLTKPFDLNEFDARVRALLRRGQTSDFRLGHLEWSRDRREAVVAGRMLELSRHETSLLEALVHAAGRTTSKSALSRVLGEGDDSAADNLVEVYVHRLRRKLDESGSGVEIRTIRGLGYRLQPIQS